MSPLLISICIPAFRAERFLERTLDSVRRQTYPHWELILVEDGSGDRTRAIVARFSRLVSQNVRYLRHDANQGLPATRNTGIAAAHGTWIALLDSDDMWTPDHLESLVPWTEGDRADLVHAGSILFQTDTGEVLETRAPSLAMQAELPRSLFTGRYVIQPASVLMRRDLWRHVGGFDPEFRYVEDRDMWLRCVRAGARIAYTGRETCLYRRHPAGLSTHAAEMAEAAAAVFAKHLDWEEIPLTLRRKLAAETWAAAGRICQRADPRRSSRNFRRACAVSWRFDWWLRALAGSVLAAVRSRHESLPAPQP